MGIRRRRVSRADYFDGMRGALIAWVQWEKLKCVPSAKHASKQRPEKSSGEKNHQSVEMKNKKKRQGQQSLEPQS